MYLPIYLFTVVQINSDYEVLKVTEKKCHQISSTVKFVEQNYIKIFALFSMQDPRAKLRFEVFSMKFHLRINLTTLFLSISYLQNTIKPFLGHENGF
jgi:hypothetical protein